MKSVILVILFMCLVSCGKNNPTVSGRDGTNGLNSSCTVITLAVGQPGAPNGGAVINCSDGSSSVVLNGTPGNSGTIVAPVQFCSGITTYPNTFNELGICVDNKVYGIYSLNGGFMTLLPPGAYSSNGVNSSCNFTIEANCIVVQN